MKRYFFLTIICVSLILGCSKKDENVSEYKLSKKNNPIEVSESSSQKGEISAKYNENKYPKFAEANIKDKLGKGNPIIAPNKFHQIIKVIDKFEPMAEKALEPRTNLEKMQWQANSVVQKAGFNDLNDYVENFIVFSEAYGTYEKVKMLDSMIVNGFDENIIKLYEAKVLKRLQEQSLTKNDLIFIHNNRKKFVKVMQVMDTFAHNMMEADF